MLLILANFFTSRLGGWAVASIVFLSMSGAVWVQGLRIDAKEGEVKQAKAALTVAVANVDLALRENGRYKELVETLTNDLDTTKQLANEAAKAVAVAKARIQVRTVTVIKEIERVSTLADQSPVPPGLAAALVGLRDAYLDPLGDYGPASDRENQPPP